MTDIERIEQEVASLSPADFATFRNWFSQYEGALWDAQFESDATGGKLDHLAEDALAELRAGKCTDL